MSNIHARLMKIQKELNCPKTLLNKFAGYNYRSTETILEALKPHLEGLSLVISDDIVEIGGRVYVKANVILSDGEHSISSSGFAREPESKKGSDESQITGAASSYARKYALNGLFLIDDTKDADATNTHGKKEEPKKPVSTAPSKDSFRRPKKKPEPAQEAFDDI